MGVKNLICSGKKLFAAYSNPKIPELKAKTLKTLLLRYQIGCIALKTASPYLYMML
jgi:hypothetical protein